MVTVRPPLLCPRPLSVNGCRISTSSGTGNVQIFQRVKNGNFARTLSTVPFRQKMSPTTLGRREPHGMKMDEED